MCKAGDITLYLGPRKCGKSHAAERLINRCSKNKLYFGTLWNDPAYQNTINNHKARRDDSWNLIEASGHLNNDIRRLDKYLSDCEEINCCLIDGLTTWAIYNSMQHGSTLFGASDICNGLSFLVNKFPHIKWFFIDVIPEVFCCKKEIVERISCNYIRLNMLCIFKNMKVYYWR